MNKENPQALDPVSMHQRRDHDRGTFDDGSLIRRARFADNVIQAGAAHSPGEWSEGVAAHGALES